MVWVSLDCYDTIDMLKKQRFSDRYFFVYSTSDFEQAPFDNLFQNDACLIFYLLTHQKDTLQELLPNAKAMAELSTDYIE